MFDVVLWRPEIPPNTGNVIRLCANSGARLHLLRPLGFELDHAKLRRAGLDYHEFATVRVHDSLDAYFAAARPPRWFAVATAGARRFDTVSFAEDDAFLFGPESSGLPAEWLNDLPADRVLRLPMRPGNRSLNLSNAVAVTIYEAWRQLEFAGGK